MSYTLDARSIADWQSCRRRHLLSVDYRPLRWRPRSLFLACLRKAIVAVSQDTAPDAAATEARTEFMQAAANPGLDILGGNPYALAREWCVMFDTILLALNPPALTEVPAARLNSQFDWRVRAHADASGELHRWITTDQWTADHMSRELHGWPVIGDIAATRRPMTLHVIEIGRESKGRRVSPWARAFKNPAMPSLRYRFTRSPTSVPVWLVDLPNETPEDWVGEMTKGGVAANLVHHVPVAVPDDAVCAETVGQVLREAISMRDAECDRESIPWRAWPMSRGACDLWSPCVWQSCCYGDAKTQPSELGLYQIRAVGYSNVAA